MKNILRNLLIIGCLISASNYRLYAQSSNYGFIQSEVGDTLNLRFQWFQPPDELGAVDSSIVNIWVTPTQAGTPIRRKTLTNTFVDFSLLKPPVGSTINVKTLVTVYRRALFTASDTLSWQYTNLASELFALVIKPDSVLTTPETQARACAIVMFASNGQYALRNPEKNVTLCQTEYTKISSIYRNPTTNQQAIADTVKVVWSYSGGSITQEN